MTFAQRYAMLAHIGWGAALTLTLGLWCSVPLATGVTFVFAGVKESLESINPTWRLWESERQPWANGVEDVAQFGIGITWAAVVLCVRKGVFHV